MESAGGAVLTVQVAVERERKRRGRTKTSSGWTDSGFRYPGRLTLLWRSERWRNRHFEVMFGTGCEKEGCGVASRTSAKVTVVQRRDKCGVCYLY